MFILYMEGQERVALEMKCPQNLDFNAPLLSTRRSNGITNIEIPDTNSICNRIPFSWEKSPGKPKDMETSDPRDMIVPPPKPPPARWNSQTEVIKMGGGDQNRAHDDDDDVDDDDVFSDAIDMLSLPDSLLNMDRAENVNGGENLEIEESSCGTQSPSFMIRRFLSDATALTASSVAKNLNEKTPHSINPYRVGQVSRQVKQSYGSRKGCGFYTLFPWRIKPKPCGVKSPVKEASVNVKSLWSTKSKKNH